jgi:hypothetical protein
MISAIVMAGYNNKYAVKKYSQIVAEHYGEKFIETGYKPLREFQVLENGKEIRKPLIRFTLEKLFAYEPIGDIVIVGHQMLLEQRLRKFIDRVGSKPCRIINQNTKLTPDIIEHFKILPRKVKYNSIGGNLIKGYAASAAFEEGRHALFIASDSPLTSIDFLSNFFTVVRAYSPLPAVVVPAVNISGNLDRLGRQPIRLLNDTPFEVPGAKDGYGRQGFRLSSLLYANPHMIDVNTINVAYNLRKCLTPAIQLRLFRITRSLGYKNVYSKYFFQKDLSVTECENITSEFFGGRLVVIPMNEEESSYDYDGTDYEYRGITEMLMKASSSEPAGER